MKRRGSSAVMHTSIFFGTLALVVLCLLRPAGAEVRDFGVQVNNGGVSGTLINPTVDVPEDDIAVVFVVPVDRVFVVTMICFAGGISGDTIGLLRSGSKSCNSFTPGLLIPPEETLTCDNRGADQPCLLVGVLVNGIQPSDSACHRADVTADGIVNILDVSFVGSHFGEVCVP